LVGVLPVWLAVSGFSSGPRQQLPLLRQTSAHCSASLLADAFYPCAQKYPQFVKNSAFYRVFIPASFLE